MSYVVQITARFSCLLNDTTESSFHQFGLKNPDFPVSVDHYVEHNYQRDWSQPPLSSVGAEQKTRKTTAQTVLCASSVVHHFQRRAQQLRNRLLPFLLT